MKWEPLVAMVLLIALGLWLVWAPHEKIGLPKARPGARLVELRVHNSRGMLEILEQPDAEPTFRLLFRDGSASPVLSKRDLQMALPARTLQEVVRAEPNALYRVMNITGSFGLFWVLLGFGAQAAFSGRFLLQWYVSERRGESVIPVGFWWMSFAGGLGLFIYFVWRQDIVGVLGQSTGIVVYARNLRLIYKSRRRDAEGELGPVTSAAGAAAQ